MGEHVDLHCGGRPCFFNIKPDEEVVILHLFGFFEGILEVHCCLTGDGAGLYSTGGGGYVGIGLAFLLGHSVEAQIGNLFAGHCVLVHV